MSKPLLVTRPGWVDEKTKAAMRRAGYLLVEAPEGEHIQVIQPMPVSDLITPDEFTSALISAVSAATNGSAFTKSNVGELFISNLAKVISAKEALAAGGQSNG